MPIIQLPMISYEELVSEPIKRQILDFIGGKINYINSSGNKLTADAEYIDLANEDDATVTITEDDWIANYGSNNVTATNIRYPIISDPSIGFEIKAADTEKEYTINVSKVFPTRSDAVWWRNQLISKIRDGATNGTNDIYITVCPPSSIINMIEALRLRKAARNSEDRSFMEYLMGIAASNLSIDTNSTKNSAALMFPEKLREVVFSFPTDLPKAVLEDGKYRMEFDIRTILKTPNVLTMRYPNFIGDTMIPKEYVDLSIDVNSEADESLDTSGYELDTLLTFKGTTAPDIRRYCYQLPSFESYTFPLRNWGLSGIFQIRVSCGLDDRRLVLNLNELFSGPIEGFELDSGLLDYMVSNREGLTSPNDTAVGVILVKDHTMVSHYLLYVDEYMCLRSKYDLDPLGDYHLVITTPYQTAAISENIFDTVEDFPNLVNKLIQHTNPGLPKDTLPVTEDKHSNGHNNKPTDDTSNTDGGGESPSGPSDGSDTGVDTDGDGNPISQVNPPISDPYHPKVPHNPNDPGDPDYQYRPVTPVVVEPVSTIDKTYKDIYRPIFNDILNNGKVIGPICANTLIVNTKYI